MLCLRLDPQGLIGKNLKSRVHAKEMMGPKQCKTTGFNIECTVRECACLLSCFSRVQLCATPWTVARQASLSMGFSRQEYWSGLPCPPPGDLPTPGIKPRSPALQVDSLPLSHQGSPQIWNVSWICVSSLHRGHANLLCFIPILVYVLNSRLISVLITKLKPPNF